MRRVDDIARQRAEGVMAGTVTAAGHLRAAGLHCYGTQPSAKQTPDQAVLALEAAAKPLISPTDTKATLGKMITTLRDKPTKWTVPFGTVEQLAEELATIWACQPRQGSDDPDAVRTVDPDVAEVALHRVITLLHLLTSGLVGRTR